jgi:hypothetical protein
MSTVTFTSGVHVGVRDDSIDFIDWFEATPTVQFATVTLALASVQVLTNVEGRAGDREPVLLRFEGGGLPASYNSLKAIDVRELQGDVKTTLSGWRDAVARSGLMVEMSLRLYGDSEARTEWGILTQVRNTIAGGERGWGVTAVFIPCDALCWVGTSNWFMSPVAYASQTA